MSLASAHTPKISLRDVKSVMIEINCSLNTWWQDSEKCNIINFAVEEGWLSRPSTTQVEWTEFGELVCQMTA